MISQSEKKSTYMRNSFDWKLYSTELRTKISYFWVGTKKLKILRFRNGQHFSSQCETHNQRAVESNEIQFYLNE